MGQIILLNGSSSSGKTTLAIKLQQLLSEPYQHIALDQFRDGMPSRVRGLNSPVGDPGASGLNVVPIEEEGQWVTQIQFGDYGEKVLKGMRRSVAEFAQLGCNVIVDDLLFKKEYLKDYVEVLNPEKTWFIGVKCSVDIMLSREALRPGRFPNTALSHYKKVHDHGLNYDLEVDTSRATPREVAQLIIQRIGQPPCAFALAKNQL
jgi:chloramphenicol 3-O phosphotransferase